MLVPTYIICFDAGQNGKVEECSRETPFGFSETDAIDLIISGDMPLPFRSVFRVACDEVTRDVTDEIARQVFNYSLRKPISPEAREWLDWCGYDLPEAAE